MSDLSTKNLGSCNMTTKLPLRITENMSPFCIGSSNSNVWHIPNRVAVREDFHFEFGASLLDQVMFSILDITVLVTVSFKVKAFSVIQAPN